MMFDILLACDIQGVIGINNKLPWSIESDASFFRKKTLYTDLPSYKNVVIMGKNTYKSVGFLNGRINIVVSSSMYNERHLKIFGTNLNDDNGSNNENEKNLILAKNLQHALTISMLLNDIEFVYVIGGADLYKEAFNHPCCRFIYLTEIQSQFEGDVAVNRPKIYKYFELCKASQVLDIDRLTNKEVTLHYNKLVSKRYLLSGKV